MHLQNQEWAGHNVLPIHWPHRSDCVWNTAVWFIIHLQTGRVTHIVLVCVYKLPVVLSMMQNITNVYLHCNSVHRLTWKSSSPTHNFFFFFVANPVLKTDCSGTVTIFSSYKHIQSSSPANGNILHEAGSGGSNRPMSGLYKLQHSSLIYSLPLNWQRHLNCPHMDWCLNVGCFTQQPFTPITPFTSPNQSEHSDFCLICFALISQCTFLYEPKKQQKKKPNPFSILPLEIHHWKKVNKHVFFFPQVHVKLTKNHQRTQSRH